MRLALIGDGESPHLLKWARALAPRVELAVVSSRGLAPALAALVPADRRLALATRPDAAGGNVGVLRRLPAVVRFLRGFRPDWLNPHYLTSHGTLAWAAVRLGGVRARIVGSAWGSDILVTPERSALMRALTRRVLAACTLTTSDSRHMAVRMRALGARGEPIVFPFGLEALPPPRAPGSPRDLGAFFANRGLEPIYQPQRVLAQFAALLERWPADWPSPRLTVANDGSMRAALQAQALAQGLPVRFVGRLDAAAQAEAYRSAAWYLSLPASDSVAVSVLEAMAHGALPLLSDLPANRELVESGRNGLLLPAAPGLLDIDALKALAPRLDAIAGDNRRWVAEHALFEPCIERFVARLTQEGAAPR